MQLASEEPPAFTLYIYMNMIPVPGPVAPPSPQWYGPLLPDLESFISMVFTACWMQNLLT